MSLYPMDVVHLGNDFEMDAETDNQIADPVVSPVNGELLEVWVGPTSGTLAIPHDFEVFLNDAAAAASALVLKAAVIFPSYVPLLLSQKVFVREGDAISMKNKNVGAVVNLRFNYVVRQG